MSSARLVAAAAVDNGGSWWWLALRSAWLREASAPGEEVPVASFLNSGSNHPASCLWFMPCDHVIRSSQ